MRSAFLAALVIAAALGGLSVVALPRERAQAQSPTLAAAPALRGPWTEYVAPPSACPGGDDALAPVAAQERTMLCLVDYARGRRGLRALVPSSALFSSAAMKGRDIASCARFAHDPCGAGSARVFDLAGYGNGAATWGHGENLAMVSFESATPRFVMNGWLNSDPHREDLFDADWTDQGVALVPKARVDGYPGVNVWVSHFGFRS